MHWVGEGTNSMHYEKINCIVFCTSLRHWTKLINFLTNTPYSYHTYSFWKKSYSFTHTFVSGLYCVHIDGLRPHIHCGCISITSLNLNFLHCTPTPGKICNGAEFDVVWLCHPGSPSTGMPLLKCLQKKTKDQVQALTVMRLPSWMILPGS
jgi:hypothetical protein